MIKLLEFPHSHFCEKARWALDYKGIPFESIAILPGIHIATILRYAPKTSVPVLLDGTKVVQGSAEITNYLEEKHPENPLIPTNKDLCLQAQNFEKDMDLKLGENVRTILYSSLLQHPEFLSYCFTHPMPKSKQLIFKLMFPILRKKIYNAYVISDSHVAQAEDEFSAVMDQLETHFKHHKFTVGDQFSRSDLALAALLSFIPMPKQHPFPWIELPDGKAKVFVEQYSKHPVSLWVVDIYKNYR